MPPGIHASDIQKVLEAAAGQQLPVVRRDGHQFIIECASAQQLQTVLKWDQGRIDGKVFRVQRTEYRMSGDEILDYVRILLEKAEERARRLPFTRMPAIERRGKARTVTSVPANIPATPAVEEPVNRPNRSPKEGNKQSQRNTEDSNRARTPPVNRGGHKGGAREARRAGTPPAELYTSRSTMASQPVDTSRPFVRFVPGECRWCADNRRPFKHDWRQCQFRSEYFAQRDARLIAMGITPPTYQPRTPGNARQNPWNNGPPKVAPTPKKPDVAVRAVATSTGDHNSSSSNSL